MQTYETAGAVKAYPPDAPKVERGLDRIENLTLRVAEINGRLKSSLSRFGAGGDTGSKPEMEAVPYGHSGWLNQLGRELSDTSDLVARIEEIM